MEDLVRDGQLTRDEAAVHPQRNILTRALGIDIDVDVDSDTVLPFTGDRFLLCSDGLFNEVTEDQMSSVLRRLADPSEAADELVRLANEGGGRDNITVVVVDVVDDGGRAEHASAVLAEMEATKAQAVVEPEPVAAAEADVDDDPFAGRRSSLPEAGDDYAALIDDPFTGMGSARSRRVTWRVLAFLLALLVVGGVVVGAVAWSARNTYHVAFQGDAVAVFRGKPGGVLWFDPTLVRTTRIERSEVPPAIRPDLDEGKEFGSESEANRYLVNLRSQIDDRERTTASTTTTTTAPVTTTTLLPATTTTVAPAVPAQP